MRWNYLQGQGLYFLGLEDDPKYDYFTCSPGFIRNIFVKTTFMQGSYMEKQKVVSFEIREAIMGPCTLKFQNKVEEKLITAEIIFNTDQTGLY